MPSEGSLARRKKKPTNVNSTKATKMKKKEEEKRKVERDGQKKERKLYSLPGQKRDTPDKRDPLRIFYETLYHEIPDCEMAQMWMMESGLLPEEEARKVCEKKQKTNMGTPTDGESASAKKRKMTLCTSDSSNKMPTNSKVRSKQSKKRKAEDGSPNFGSEDDLVRASKKTKKQKGA